MDGAEEAGFCAAVAVVDYAGVDEGAEEGDAGICGLAGFGDGVGAVVVFTSCARSLELRCERAGDLQ